MKITYLELRELIKKVYTSYPGVKWLPKSLVVNEGFPGTFNLSLNEPNLLQEFGSYIDFDHNFMFGKIQPVIRTNDWLDVVSKAKDTKHLVLFEMAGISLIDTDPTTYEKHAKGIIGLLSRIFFTELGLDPKKLYVKVCAGGTVEKLTGGRYAFPKTISKDLLTYKEWKKKGVPEKNFIWDETRDTFLSLFMFTHPTPWGYRNELLYDIGGGIDEDSLLDIGTVEYLPWNPVIESEGKKLRHYMITDIVPASAGIAVGGCGMERLLMAVNGMKSEMECDHINQLYSRILSDVGGRDKKVAYMATECIRVIHRVLLDTETYADLGRKRQEKLVYFIDTLQEILQTKGIPIVNISQYFHLNALANPQYPELMSYERVMRDVKRVMERKTAEPLWSRAEFLDGVEGLEKVIEEMMEEKGIPMYGIVSASVLKRMPELATRFRGTRIQRDISLKVITDATKEMAERAKLDKQELRELRFSPYLTHLLSSAIYVWGNKVALLNTADKGGGGMIVENKELAELIRRLFKQSWEELKPTKEE